MNSYRFKTTPLKLPKRVFWFSAWLTIVSIVSSLVLAVFCPADLVQRWRVLTKIFNSGAAIRFNVSLRSVSSCSSSKKPVQKWHLKIKALIWVTKRYDKVKHCFSHTHLIHTHYYQLFSLLYPCGKNPYTSSKFNLPKYGHPFNTDTFNGPSVTIIINGFWLNIKGRNDSD